MAENTLRWIDNINLKRSRMIPLKTIYIYLNNNEVVYSFEPKIRTARAYSVPHYPIHQLTQCVAKTVITLLVKNLLSVFVGSVGNWRYTDEDPNIIFNNLSKKVAVFKNLKLLWKNNFTFQKQN